MIIVKAICLLKEKYNLNIDVFFAGSLKDPDYKQEIDKLVDKYKLNNNVHFLGQCNNILEIFGNVDILCMSSKCEAFGRVTVEGMLTGCLIIGSDSGGTSELISDQQTGYLFEKGNYEMLAEKIKVSIDNKEKSRKLAKAGQIDAYNNYNSENNAKKIYNIYQKLI